MYAFSRSVFLSYKPLMKKDSKEIQSLLKTKGIPHFEQNTLFDICKLAISVLSQQPTLIRVEADEWTPVVVIGDLHGSIVDILRLFATYGLPPDTKYVFLGDYVDRGEFSIDVMTLLLSAKCVYPDHIIMLRGNHEFKNVCSSYGFRDELLDMGYQPDLFNTFIDVFAYLPLAAVVNNSIFCVHGGISSNINCLSDIENIQRPIYDFTNHEEDVYTYRKPLQRIDQRNYQQIYQNKLIEDILWSDPSKCGACEFIPSARNHGCLFGSSAVNNFYEKTGLNVIIRGHSFVKEGFVLYEHSNLISVFSSSNYDQLPNYCGVIVIDQDSNITPEVLDAVVKVNKKDVKLNTNPINSSYKKSIGGSTEFPSFSKRPSASSIVQLKTPTNFSNPKGSLPTLKFNF